MAIFTKDGSAIEWAYEHIEFEFWRRISVLHNTKIQIQRVHMPIQSLIHL